MLALLLGLATASAAPDIAVLRVEPGPLPITPGLRIVRAWVRNDGADPSGNFLVEVGLTETAGAGDVLCTRPMSSLNGGDSANADVVCTFPAALPDDALLFARVQPGNLPDDADPSNDRVERAVTLSEASAPDLRLVAANPPLVARSTEVFDLPVRVANDGPVAALGVRVRVRGSLDATYDVTDPVLCDTVVDVPPGEVDLTLLDCVAPAAGSAWVHVRVDPFDEVDELDESDNHGQLPWTVAAAWTDAAVPFTGRAMDDFAGRPVVRLLDGAGPNREILDPVAEAFGIASGFDVRQVLTYVEPGTNTLHTAIVGWTDPHTQQAVILGDADGDSDPASLDPAWRDWGADPADLGDDEGAGLWLQDPGGFTRGALMLGVDATHTLAGARIAEVGAANDATARILAFGSTIPGQVPDLGPSPSPSAPDLELRIRRLGELFAQGTFPAGHPVRALAFAGSRAALQAGDDDRTGWVLLGLYRATGADPFADVDGDGFVLDDCKPTVNIAHPGAIEVCNNADDDCDGQIDEGVDCGFLDNDDDNDGLSNNRETGSILPPVIGLGTDPNDPDSDDDGLSDGAEHNTWGTDPLDPDDDGGGVPDGVEVRRGTDPTDPGDDDPDRDGWGTGDPAPNDADLDDDGLLDGDERDLGTNPALADSDGDTLSDGYEVEILGTDPGEADSDHDGLRDDAELLAGSDPLDDDTDGDGLKDGVEVNTWGSDPTLADSDGGGVIDSAEVSAGHDPNDPLDDDPDEDGLSNGAEDLAGSDRFDDDSDGDGLSDGDEVLTWGTDPTEPDSDFDGLDDPTEVAGPTDPNDDDSDDDGLSDGDEVNVWGTDPNDDDSDGGGEQDGDEVDRGADPEDPTDDDGDQDGLSNAEEATAGTEPDNPDSDDDGLSDGDEVNVWGTNPNDDDTDGGGVSDGDEVDAGFDPDDDTDDALQVDSDGDGLTDAREATLGTEPDDPDSDNDGLQDGEEVDTFSTDPLDPDSDGDGLDDGEEVLTHGTNPRVRDTDGGGEPDGHEIDAGRDPLDDRDDVPLDTDLPADTDDTGLDDTDAVDTAGDNGPGGTGDAADPRWFCATGPSPRALWLLALTAALLRRRRSA